MANTYIHTYIYAYESEWICTCVWKMEKNLWRIRTGHLQHLKQLVGVVLSQRINITATGNVIVVVVAANYAICLGPQNKCEKCKNINRKYPSGKCGSAAWIWKWEEEGKIIIFICICNVYTFYQVSLLEWDSSKESSTRCCTLDLATKHLSSKHTNTNVQAHTNIHKHRYTYTDMYMKS